MGTVKKYIDETIRELKKVSWPERDVVLTSSGVVVVLILVLGLIFFVEDTILQAIFYLFVK